MNFFSKRLIIDVLNKISAILLQTSAFLGCSLTQTDFGFKWYNFITISVHLVEMVAAMPSIKYCVI